MPRRLQTIRGIGPIGALAIETFAPPMNQFRRGRDFAAWIGLVPRQHSSGGKQRLGKTSKNRQRNIRRLLITGAISVIRWAMRKGAPQRCRRFGSDSRITIPASGGKSAAKTGLTNVALDHLFIHSDFPCKRSGIHKNSLDDDRTRSAGIWENANRKFHATLLSRCPSKWMLRLGRACGTGRNAIVGKPWF